MRNDRTIGRTYGTYIVVVLFLTHVLSYMDRMALAVLLPAIKIDFALTDLQLGLLTGIAFSVSYALAGIPIARVADRSNRRNIIGVAVIVWSGMTAASGAAAQFWSLMLARIGVGAGEAGCIPPAHSMIADAVPPRARVGALSFYTTGMPIGALLGLALGGWLVESIGWRQTFYVFGAVGLVLALVLFLTVSEPGRRMDAQHPSAPKRSLGEDLRDVARNPAFLFLLGGLGFAGFALTGLVQWLPSYLARNFTLSISEIGASFGLVYGVGSLAGILLGGIVAGPLFGRDQRWAMWMGTGAYVVAFPILMLAIFTSSYLTAMICLFFGFAILTSCFGPIYALVQNIMRPDMRAFAISLTLLASNLIGAGLGPLLIGFASDAALADGAENPLRIGLLVGMAFFPFPAILYFIGARFLSANPDFQSHQQGAAA